MRIEPLSTDPTQRLATPREQKIRDRADEAIADVTARAADRGTQLEETRNLNLALHPELEDKINQRYDQKAAKLDAKLADKIGHIEDKVDSFLANHDDDNEIDVTG